MKTTRLLLYRIIMSCCGQAKNIVKGYTRLATDIIGLTKPYEFTDGRIRICQGCTENTWLSAIEYDAWLLRHGITVLKNFNQLSKLPKLPKHEQGPGRRRLYCRICKCFVPAAARVSEKKCSLDKW